MWAPFCDIFSPRAQEERCLEKEVVEITKENRSISKLNLHIRRFVIGMVFIIGSIAMIAFLLKFTSIFILSFVVAVAYFIGYCAEEWTS